MLQELWAWVRALFGAKARKPPAEPDKHAEEYEMNRQNITATIANKLAMLVFADSQINVQGSGARAELVSGVMEALMKDADWITAQAFGKGGKVLAPVLHNGHIDVQPIDQNRMLVRRLDGEKIVEATLMCDVETVDDETYYLLADYALRGDVQTIRYRACGESGGAVALDAILKWAGVTPEISISGTDRLLFAFLRCPRDNRREMHIHGVPITYGAELDVEELAEHMRIYRREYRLTRPMLGLDASLWRDPNARIGADARGLNISDVKANVQDGDYPFVPVQGSSLDAGSMWPYFAPAIRDAAMETRYQTLCRRVEKACGLSQGVLTERQALNYANRDEVRAAQYDTFSVIKAMRDNWEQAASDVAYAVDVLAERFGLTPSGSRGQYELTFDWDMSLIESSAETFAQWSELNSRGMISDAELRQWVMGGTLEEAEAALEEIKASGQGSTELDRLLGAVDNTVDNPEAE